jgi:hypothetical protein
MPNSLATWPASRLGRAAPSHPGHLSPSSFTLCRWPAVTRTAAASPLTAISRYTRRRVSSTQRADPPYNRALSFQDDDVNLASSTMVPEGKAPNENMGIVISYSVRVKLNCGTLGGELVTDVPLKLMHPAVGKLWPSPWAVLL